MFITIFGVELFKKGEKKMKRAILTVFVTVLLVTAANSFADDLSHQHGRHGRELLARRRQQIDRQYTEQLHKLRRRSERRINRLKPSDREVFNPLIRYIRQEVYASTYSPYDRYFSETIELSFLIDPATGQPHFSYTNTLRYRQTYRHILDILKKYKYELAQAKSIRDTRLAMEDRREKALRAAPEAPIPTAVAKTPPQKPLLGRVAAISYNHPNPFIMIEGLEPDAVYQGQTIDGITVTRIDPYKVQFQKERKTWTQKIGQPPDPAWM